MNIEKAIIVSISGTSEFKAFLLSHNITIGTVFGFNYSPDFSQLVNLTVANRMLCIRRNEFDKLEWIQLR